MRCLALTLLAGLVACTPVRHFDPLSQDPAQRSASHPATARDVRFASQGAQLAGRLFLADGPGPHPTVILARGLPDALGSLDVGMALRRAGFNVLSFNYRGCWGSPGTFSLRHSLQDIEAAVGFLRTAGNQQEYRIDPERLMLLGHSLGGPAVLRAAAADARIRSVALIDGTDMRSEIEELRKAPQPFMNWLQSLGMVTVESTTAYVDEILHDADFWSPTAITDALAGKSLLIIVASEGTGAEPPPGPSLADLYRARSRVTDYRFDTDHGFNDQRMTLTRRVVEWAKAHE